jgi:hypothetical protein
MPPKLSIFLHVGIWRRLQSYLRDCHKMASGDALRAGRLIFIWSSVYCPMEITLKGTT